MARLSMEVDGTPTDFGGSLHLDMREVNVQECVNVYWDFSSSAYVPNSRDFIGLFEVGKLVLRIELVLFLAVRPKYAAALVR